jgi:hypothetical protein
MIANGYFSYQMIRKAAVYLPGLSPGWFNDELILHDFEYCTYFWKVQFIIGVFVQKNHGNFRRRHFCTILHDTGGCGG